MKLLALAVFALAGTAAQDDPRKSLRSSDDRERQRAVRGLADEGSAESWGLVLGALADPEPRVADEAQLVLAALSDPAQLALFFGKDGIGSRREDTAVRVAEALGRLKAPVPAAELARALGHRDAEVRSAVAWSIERLARAGHLVGGEDGELTKALVRVQAKDKSPYARAAALAALHAAEPERAVPLATASIRDELPELRCCAASLCRAIPPGPEPRLQLLSRDESRAVRLQVAEEFARSGARDDVSELVGMLEREEDRRVAWRLVELLQDLSRLHHGLDARPWRGWAEGLAEDWQPSSGEGEREYGPRTAAFAGLPVLSGKVCFLVDLSGSMWKDGEDGRTRKQAADAEVTRLLESLPDDTLFNVIPYTEKPLPWRKSLVPATSANVKRAAADFVKRKDHGQGDFWSAYQLALEDPEVDTVMVLTDGAPTGGRRWNLKLMKTLLPQQNRFRKVVLDALLFDCPDFLQRHWTDMCAATGGRCTTVDL